MSLTRSVLLCTTLGSEKYNSSVWDNYDDMIYQVKKGASEWKGWEWGERVCVSYCVCVHVSVRA